MCSLEIMLRPHHMASEGDMKQVTEHRRELMSAKWRKPRTLTSCGVSIIQVRHFRDLSNFLKNLF